MGMSGECAEQPAGLQVPQLDLLVRAAASEPLAVGAESHGEDPVRVVEGMEGFPVGKLPYPDGLVEATAREEVPVGTEGYGADPARVPGEGADRLTGTHVPSSDRVVGATAGEELPVGAERYGVNLVRVPG